MTFSILIPVYKAENYLEETVASVLRQKGDYEIVLVEDGSPDASGALCDKLSAAHPGRKAAFARRVALPPGALLFKHGHMPTTITEKGWKNEQICRP